MAGLEPTQVEMRKLAVRLHLQDGLSLNQTKEEINRVYHSDKTKSWVMYQVRKYRQNQDLNNRKKDNGKTKLTEEIKRFIVLLTDLNHDLCAYSVQNLINNQYHTNISLYAIRRFRHSKGYRYRMKRLQHFVNHRAKFLRMQFASHFIAQGRSADNFIFIDECTIYLENTPKRGFGKKENGRWSYIPKRSQTKSKLKVNVLGGISRRGPTPLMIYNENTNAEVYSRYINNFYIPYVNRVWPDGAFLYSDNATYHKRVNLNLQNEGYGVVFAPPLSADANVSELPWAAMKSFIRCKWRPSTQAELIEGVDYYWTTVLTLDQCTRMCNRFYRVLHEIVRNEGGNTGM